MVEKKLRCDGCGSDSAPEGARFCPNCGVNLTLGDDGSGVPMAAAVHIDEPEIQVPSSGTTNSAAFPSSSSHNDHDNPASASSTGYPAAAASYAETESTEGALYWKNPSPALLARATSQTEAGILFIQTPNYAKGKFALAKSLSVGHILSGTKIDLSRADFVHPITTIHAGTILGGVKVIVPRGVRVETNGIGILGGFKGMQSQTVNAGQDAPLIVINGLAILGGVKVIVNTTVPPVRIVAH